MLIFASPAPAATSIYRWRILVSGDEINSRGATGEGDTRHGRMQQGIRKGAHVAGLCQLLRFMLRGGQVPLEAGELQVVRPPVDRLGPLRIPKQALRHLLGRARLVAPSLGTLRPLLRALPRGLCSCFLRVRRAQSSGAR